MEQSVLHRRTRRLVQTMANPRMKTGAQQRCYARLLSARQNTPPCVTLEFVVPLEHQNILRL